MALRYQPVASCMFLQLGSIPNQVIKPHWLIDLIFSAHLDRLVSAIKFI